MINGRGIIVWEFGLAGGSVLFFDAGPCDEGLVGGLIASVAGLDGQLMPSVLVGVEGLASMRVAGGQRGKCQ